MEQYARYFLISSIAIAIFYILYLFLLKKDRNFKFHRLYLCTSLVFSLVLPLNRYSLPLLDAPFSVEKTIFANKTISNINQENNSNEYISAAYSNPKTNVIIDNNILLASVKVFFPIIYLIIVSIFLMRLCVSIVKVIFFYNKSSKEKKDKYIVVYLDKRITPFSFFRYIYINKATPQSDLKKIIAHEKIHVQQFHTLDLIIFELVASVFWFNPFVWMYKKSLQQVHEFLADEGAINSGIDKYEYQALLINQIAEDRLVAISSNFSYSLIKKRLMMLSETKSNARRGNKTLSMLLTSTILFLVVSAFNKPENTKITTEEFPQSEIEILYPEKTKIPKLNVGITESENNSILSEQPSDTVPKNKLISAASLTKMNVLYIGVDNPVSIAVSETKTDRVKVKIDKGTIRGENGNYIIRVHELGKATLSVYVDDKIVSTHEFRVKKVPDPTAVIQGYEWISEISKEDLIAAGGIEVSLKNFDFDLKFEIVSYSLSTINGAGVLSESRQNNSNEFSKEQITLINEAVEGGKIYFEDIKVKGPDGTIRRISPIVIKIK